MSILVNISVISSSIHGYIAVKGLTIKTNPLRMIKKFFSQPNGLTQYISNTTRNLDKTKSLIDLAMTNSKFVKDAGTLEHFISDHQPIFIVHKKSRIPEIPLNSHEGPTGTLIKISFKRGYVI